jgi:hypothetical protein
MSQIAGTVGKQTGVEIMEGYRDLAKYQAGYQGSANKTKAE